MIPALNTDLAVKAYNGQPEVSDFVEAVFQQMIDKKVELTFGFSEVIAKATPKL
jgi:uncharacterized oxidoreductase